MNTIEETEALEEHHHFIVTTDRKSLFTQLKGLVAKAQEIADEELESRRMRLKELLEYEDKIYEEEFSNKVKSRIEEDIKERKQTLHKIKEANEKAASEYLESKRIQQYMNNCYEIREALRRKEQQNVKECQLEQIAENERKLRREKDLQLYWLGVQRKNMERYDKRQESENCIKSQLAKQHRFVLDVQMEEKQAKAAKQHQEKQKDVENLSGVLEELRLEKFERQHTAGGVSAKTMQYRNELLAEIEKKRDEQLNEKCQLAKEHQTMMEECQRLDAEELSANEARKRAVHEAAMDYIAYVKRMRRLEENQQRMRDDRIDDLGTVDKCTKSNIKREMQRRAEVAAATYAEVKRQICEQRERRLREEIEYKENKMLENRFVKPERTRAEELQQKSKMREELDKQIAEIHRIRKLEEEEYSNNLKRAIDDPKFCAQLAEQYIRDGTDYLEPHANWRILACPTKKYVAKKPMPYPDCADIPKDGSGGDCVDEKPPCGCRARNKYYCGVVGQHARPEGDREF